MRRRIAVACGVLQQPTGAVLITQRPAGKIAAGKWEFPGGKIEVGESALQALTRELQEEIGIHVTQARPLIRLHHDYTDRSVELDTWLVTAWDGEVHGREAQAHAWVAPVRLHDYDLLGADGPIVTALRLPSLYVFTPPEASLEYLLAGLARLPAGCALRLRMPALSDAEYQQWAQRLIPAASERGIAMVLDRDPQMALQLGAMGWHAPASVWRSGIERPADLLALASCHSAEDLSQVRRQGFDAAVLGSVQATATHPSQLPMGWGNFASQLAQASMPVYALGGVGLRDLERAWSCYAQGVAGIRSFWC